MKLPLKILDLFAGPGGLSLGFELAKYKNERVFQLQYTVEINVHSCNTLKENYGEKKVIQGDLTDNDFKDKVIGKCLKYGKPIIDLVIAGIPCQSFSLIGSRSGNNKKEKDSRDSLYQEFLYFVKELKPKIFLIENVRGILSKKDENDSKIFDYIISDFENLGYCLKNDRNNEKYLLLNAVYYGVPQRRERVFIIGLREDINDTLIPFPPETHFYRQPYNQTQFETKTDNLISIPSNLNKCITIKEAIGDLPAIQAKFTYTDLDKNQKIKIQKINSKIDKKDLAGKDQTIITNEDKNKYKTFLESLSKYKEAINFQEYVRDSDIIQGHIARSQQTSDIELFGLLPEGWTSKDVFDENNDDFKELKTRLRKLIKYDCSSSFSDKYRKQKWDEPSTTIYAHLQKDGNRFIHPKQARTFTPREVARLQSFPDSFIFKGPMTQQFKQIGNAVPPLLAKAIAEALIKCLIS